MKTTEQKIDDVVADLENEAEGQNYHGMCAMYRDLTVILLEVVSEEDTLKILKKVKQASGFLP